MRPCSSVVVEAVPLQTVERETEEDQGREDQDLTLALALSMSKPAD